MAISIDYSLNKGTQTGIINGNNNFYIKFSSDDVTATNLAKVEVTNIPEGVLISQPFKLSSDDDGVFIFNTIGISKSILTTSEENDSYDYSGNLTSYDSRLKIQLSIKITVILENGEDSETIGGISFIQSIDNKTPYTNVLDILQPITPIPYFQNYPLEYIFANTGFLTTRNLASLPDSNLILKDKENGVYLKWLNSKGGYSYWLFDCVYQESLETKSIGTYRSQFESINRLKDLGKESKTNLTINSTFIEDEILLIRSLAKSPEVYYYNSDNEFEIVILSKFNEQVLNTKTNNSIEVFIELEVANESITFV